MLGELLSYGTIQYALARGSLRLHEASKLTKFILSI